MLHGGLAHRIVNLANACAGWVRGGLGMVTVLACMLFGGISGSAIADTSAIGAVMIPMMKRKGYSPDYAVNVTINSSMIGLIVPPSHNMILYALSAGGGISIASLFMAGLVPGVLVGLSLMITAYLVAVKQGYPAERFPGWPALFGLLLSALPGLLTVFVIVGGILSGIFTPTESSAIAVLYALLITACVYRTLSFADFKKATFNAMRTTSMVLFIIGSSAAFGWLLALNQVPEKMIHFLTHVSQTPWVVFLLVNVALLLLGHIMDMAPLILITTPIFLPVVKSFGMSPIQFGVIVMMNLGLGLVTPPVGSVLFAGCSIAKIRVEDTFKSIWPFYVAGLVALFLVTYIPAISLTLPALVAR